MGASSTVDDPVDSVKRNDEPEGLAMLGMGRARTRWLGRRTRVAFARMGIRDAVRVAL